MRYGRLVRILRSHYAKCIGVALLAVAGSLWTGAAWAAEPSALSDQPIPIEPEKLPGRTPPIIEIGPSFLGAGSIPEGIELPTGAVWTPALWVFGDLRTAINVFDSGVENQEVVEWANRLNIFFNLHLSGTERLLVGFEPVHDNRNFSGFIFDPDSRHGFENALNVDLTTGFFEGEFGEIFPNLDPQDTGALDIGFAIGKQPIFFQEGIMFNDTIDAVAITRDTIMFRDLSVDTRITGLIGFSDIDRDDNLEDDNATVFGVFTETDFPKTTTNFDAAYVLSTGDENGDGLYFGASATQRFGLWNTSFRANASFALEDETEAVSTGGLLFAEISTTPIGTDDVAYGNFFWGIEEYASVARDELTGGPLGRVGLLFASVALGNYLAPLSNRADNVVGGSIGYQKFWNDSRTQVVLEVGGRKATATGTDDAAAIGARFQQRIGNRWIFQMDGFARWVEGPDEGFGIRSELQTLF